MVSLNKKERALLSIAAASAAPRQTRWCVVTGAPGSGKTTLCELLASQGWPVIEDPGRAILEQYRARGVEVERSGASYMHLQEQVLRKELLEIAKTDPMQRVFFDYGIAESLAFMKVTGLSWPTQFIEAAAELQFEKVFLLSPISLKHAHDGIRTETETQRQQLYKLINLIYTSLGMHVINIPTGSPLQRLNTIQEALH